MRRRHRLHVDTFPFLAVLLCAMGSLLLVLLTMDRKARRAAQAKAQAAARRQLEEQLNDLARRRTEAEQRRQAMRLVWDKKREGMLARVAAEEKAVEAELHAVRARLAEAVRRLRDEEGAVEQLRHRLEEQRQRLGSKAEAVAAARSRAAGAVAKASHTDQEKVRLAGELLSLEEKLQALRAARQRDAHTYSVIPYHGKRGEARQPLYVECHRDGLIFHPDRQCLGLAAEPAAIRAEVERRLAAQKKELPPGADTRPYLLLLVRPDGVPRYYELQAAVRDLAIEFGYEFVDADWVLDFPKATAAPPRVEPQVVRATPGSPSASATPPRGLSSSVGLSRPMPYGNDSRGSPAAPALPHPDAPVPSIVPIPKPVQTGPAGGPALPLLGRPAPSGGMAGASAQGSASEPPARPATPPASRQTPAVETPRRPAAMRPAALSDTNEYIVFIECQKDRVLVHPGRRHIAIESLNHSPGHNPLFQTVRRLVQARQSISLPGGHPPRVQVRFLVHIDGEPTFHLAYPALETLPVPKTRTTLRPEDDVSRILAGP